MLLIFCQSYSQSSLFACKELSASCPTGIDPIRTALAWASIQTFAHTTDIFRSKRHRFLGLLKKAPRMTARIRHRHRMKHINFKEMFTILYAFDEWGDEWKGDAVNVKCDNSPVVNGINKKSICGSAIEPLQRLLLAAIYDIAVRATWIPMEENAITDAQKWGFHHLQNQNAESCDHSAGRKHPADSHPKKKERICWNCLCSTNSNYA